MSGVKPQSSATAAAATTATLSTAAGQVAQTGASGVTSLKPGGPFLGDIMVRSVAFEIPVPSSLSWGGRYQSA